MMISAKHSSFKIKCLACFVINFYKYYFVCAYVTKSAERIAESLVYSRRGSCQVWFGKGGYETMPKMMQMFCRPHVINC